MFCATLKTFWSQNYILNYTRIMLLNSKFKVILPFITTIKLVNKRIFKRWKKYVHVCVCDIICVAFNIKQIITCIIICKNIWNITDCCLSLKFSKDLKPIIIINIYHRPKFMQIQWICSLMEPSFNPSCWTPQHVCILSISWVNFLMHKCICKWVPGTC